MDEVEVLRQLQTVYGHEPAALQTARSTIEAACIEMAARLKKPEYGAYPAVVSAAAAVCHFRLLLQSEQFRDGTTVFKAGDVSVQISRAAMLEAAEYMRAECLAAAAPYLYDDGFLFAQVTA